MKKSAQKIFDESCVEAAARLAKMIEDEVMKEVYKYEGKDVPTEDVSSGNAYPSVRGAEVE